jgi:hypothetical protein
VIGAGSLEFALARMHARLGRRPQEAAWRAIEQARGVEPVTALIVGTTLAELAKALLVAPDLHALDRAAHAAWRGAVADTAAWMPPEYAGAIDWCAPLPLMPALGYLALGMPPPLWMRAHPELGALAAAAPAERSGLLGAIGLAPLAAVWAQPTEFVAAWILEWRRRLPRDARGDTPLAELAGFIVAHFAALGRVEPHRSTPLGEQLERGLLQRIRRHALDPVAAFAWLALTAFDIRRLRGELARRIGLPDARPVP